MKLSLSRTGRGTGKSPRIVLFTTVFVDLIGFGMVIPLVGMYGRHFGATGWQLGVLGASFSLMQFLFAPFWGSLSDRVGRRPILLMSLAGSTLAYLGFGLAQDYATLLLTRMFAGMFAANISAAQAYMADVTSHQDRAKGMGLLGAAFGIGFTLGPPLGGIAASQISLGAPGFIAAALCGVNAVLAYFRLPESLPVQARTAKEWSHYLPFHPEKVRFVLDQPNLVLLLLVYFGGIFAFSNMEQSFSLLFQSRFGFETGEAGYRTGMVLMWSGAVGALVQGGLIRKWVPRYGEWKLLLAGVLLQILGMALFPYIPSYGWYFLGVIPLSLGSGLINPCIQALISKSVGPRDQGTVMGFSQGLGSMGRALGPFCGLTAFVVSPVLPFWIATLCTVLVFFLILSIKQRNNI